LVGFVVFFLPCRPPAFVTAALGACLDELGRAFAESATDPDATPTHKATPAKITRTRLHTRV
jgi:hypothetical protein